MRNSRLQSALVGLTAATMLFALALTAMPLAAEDSVKFTRPGDHAATLVGDRGMPANDIYPVDFIEINGRPVGDDRSVLSLEPGMYTITVRMRVRNPPGGTARFRERHERGYNQIELAAEAGKTYHIGAKYDRSDRRSPYSVVVYRIDGEDSGN